MVRILDTGIDGQTSDHHPGTIMYMTESAKTHLEVFAKHSHDYLTSFEEWEACMCTPTQSIRTHQLITVTHGTDLSVPVTQPIVEGAAHH